MNREQELNELKRQYIDIEIPEDGADNMKEAIQRAKLEKRKNLYKRFKTFGISVAAAAAIFVAVPNISPTAAMAMEKIPVIGSIVKVVTIRNYDFKDDYHDAKAEIPKVEGEGKDIESLNDDIDYYISSIIETFQKEVEENGQSYKALDVSYDTVTDTPDWFTLKITVLETQASSYQHYKYYNIDKQTGNIVNLSDLFSDKPDYKEVISENIKQQMKEQMENDDSLVYWVDTEIEEDNFKTISDNQNFYINSDGNIVIAFDGYEVAPGYMGTPEFIIPNGIL